MVYRTVSQIVGAVRGSEGKKVAEAERKGETESERILRERTGKGRG